MKVIPAIFSCSVLFFACGTNEIQIEPTPDDMRDSGDVNGDDSCTETSLNTCPPIDSNDNASSLPERFAEPKNLGQQLSFYATYYFLPVVENFLGPHRLLDMKGRDLGVGLSQKTWCDAAMEGSIGVKNKDGTYTTYNYAGTGSYQQVDCSPYYNHAPSERVRFSKVDAPFGLGVSGYDLVPYRSIATFPAHIPTGSVIYIPEARNVVVTLPDGRKWKHDGYFMAADVGGKIESGHIDVFIGPANKNPFSFVTSQPKDRKSAYIVNDSRIRSALKSAHNKK